jgi:uncharacterized protein (UPF0335 family)
MEQSNVHASGVSVGGISAGQLRSFIEKIERLEDEKAEIANTIRDVFAEAKAEGFDVKVMRQVIRMRKMKKEELAEQEELLDLYCHALGMAV